MSNHITVDDFDPLEIDSGGTITIDFTYTADQDGFVVVNESMDFDAVPGRIDVLAGIDMPKRADIALTRQPASVAKSCRVTLTLGAASHSILVRVR